MEGTTDELARAIALWGAGVATLLAALELFKLFRGRPRVVVSWEGSVNRTGAQLELRLVNPPTAPPVTVIEAGLISADVEPIEGQEPDFAEPVMVRPMLPFLKDDATLFLTPGEARTVTLAPIKALPPFESDDVSTEYRAYAVDAQDRVMRGNKRQFFRELLLMHWKPAVPIPEDDPFHTGCLTVLPTRRFAWLWARLMTWRRYRI